MGGFGSGGANRKPVEAHVLSGSFRQDRHAAAARLLAAEPPPLSAAERRAILLKLPPAARRLAEALLDGFDGWDAGKLRTLRSYVLTCHRLAQLEASPPADTRELHREIRAALALRKALGLERIV